MLEQQLLPSHGDLVWLDLLLPKNAVKILLGRTARCQSVL